MCASASKAALISWFRLSTPRVPGVVHGLFRGGEIPVKRGETERLADRLAVPVDVRTQLACGRAPVRAGFESVERGLRLTEELPGEMLVVRAVCVTPDRVIGIVSGPFEVSPRDSRLLVRPGGRSQ